MFDKEKVQPVRIQCCVRPEDKEEILAAAAEEGLTLSDYIRKAIKFYYESTHSPANTAH